MLGAVAASGAALALHRPCAARCTSSAPPAAGTPTACASCSGKTKGGGPRVEEFQVDGLHDIFRTLLHLK